VMRLAMLAPLALISANSSCFFCCDPGAAVPRGVRLQAAARRAHVCRQCRWRHGVVAAPGHRAAASVPVCVILLCLCWLPWNALSWHLCCRLVVSHCVVCD
jgi:hypothetical protein